MFGRLLLLLFQVLTVFSYCEYCGDYWFDVVSRFFFFMNENQKKKQPFFFHEIFCANDHIKLFKVAG